MRTKTSRLWALAVLSMSGALAMVGCGSKTVSPTDATTDAATSSISNSSSSSISTATSDSNSSNDSTRLSSGIPTVAGKIVIKSVSPLGAGAMTTGLFKRTAVSFNTPSTPPASFIISGAPDSMVVTLKRISATTDSGEQVIWEGTQSLTLKGDGTVKLDSLPLKIPLLHISKLTIALSNSAQISGSLHQPMLTGDNKTVDQIIYTKKAFAYDAATHLGGADSTDSLIAAFKNAPAELSPITLSGDGPELSIETLADYLPTATDSAPVLTIVFDLSRSLRFYDAGNVGHTGGVNPSDPADRAYFFCHTTFGNSVASFIGNLGKIQGYATTYSYTDADHLGQYMGVHGWMTAIFNSNDSLISAILNGDDDNALTIGKGILVTSTGSDPYDFHYNISDADITGFSTTSTLGGITYATWVQPATADYGQRSGEVQFTLGFQTK